MTGETVVFGICAGVAATATMSEGTSGVEDIHNELDESSLLRLRSLVDREGAPARLARQRPEDHRRLTGRRAGQTGCSQIPVRAELDPINHCIIHTPSIETTVQINTICCCLPLGDVRFSVRKSM